MILAKNNKYIYTYKSMYQNENFFNATFYKNKNLKKYTQVNINGYKYAQ